VVFKAVHQPTQQVCVLKTMTLGGRSEREVRKEVGMLGGLENKYVIRCLGSFVEEGKAYIVMEWAEGGDLQRVIKAQREMRQYLPEKEVWRYARETSSAVAYLHQNGILHRDIKPMNVFLTKDNHVKLGDLGASKVAREAALQVTRIGTPLYLAPEQVLRAPYDFKVDIWALGCLLYQLAALHPPFKGHSLLTLYQSILHHQPKPLPRCYSPRLSHFIKSMLEKRSSARPTITEVLRLIPGLQEGLETVTADVTVGRGDRKSAKTVKEGEKKGSRGVTPVRMRRNVVSQLEAYSSRDSSSSPYPGRSPSPDYCSSRPRTSSNPRFSEDYSPISAQRHRQRSHDLRPESVLGVRPESAADSLLVYHPARLMSLIQPSILLPLCSKPQTPLRQRKKVSVSALHD